jgi:hypothetical protein
MMIGMDIIPEEDIKEYSLWYILCSFSGKEKGVQIVAGTLGKERE